MSRLATFILAALLDNAPPVLFTGGDGGPPTRATFWVLLVGSAVVFLFSGGMAATYALMKKEGWHTFLWGAILSGAMLALAGVTLYPPAASCFVMCLER